MRKQSLFAAAIVVSMLFGACKKEKSPETGATRTAEEFLEKFGAQEQSFSFNASALPKTITLAGGTKITIPAGAFTRNGTPVTGALEVNVTEFLTRSSLIRSGVNTNHISGLLLESQGSLFIDVSNNGQAVDQALQAPLNIAVPAKGDGFTLLWAGVDTVQGNQFAWQAPPNNGQQQQRETKAVEGFYNFDFGQIGWVNCDIFYGNSSPKTTVRVEVLNNPGAMASFRASSGETFVFFCAKGANVVAQIYTPGGTNKVKSYDNSMPVGTEGRLLAFSIKDGKYYLAQKDITISAGLSEAVTLIETTEASIQAAMDALNTY
ncbi:hypothetical protein MKQ68_13130 [Chitinophaga horti]|uniref:Uncharacterized protein n=1 Tax=Chitinophaga horti TaxID=2920382 RepID=A0ABY6IYQ4_9BACT|nr:hypothetical protein [Chitinophaga horti]UYQ91037.1 hypothetical protein MKQ68_13130 [Chitinophaga horti]